MTSHELHYNQDTVNGNAESDEAYARAMEELDMPEDIPNWWEQ